MHADVCVYVYVTVQPQLENFQLGKEGEQSRVKQRRTEKDF